VDIEVVVGDITKQNVDVVVNAANSSLLGGGGVDGAIHRSAGSELVHACRLLGGCKTGEAKITKGFSFKPGGSCIPVGPVWRGGSEGEPELLAACYRRSLEEATKISARTIAFRRSQRESMAIQLTLQVKLRLKRSRPLMVT
jgi:O-acetyl-ADP-ribose deacetylase